MPTVRAAGAGAGEPVREDAALMVTTKFAFDTGRHALPVPVVFTRACEIHLQVLLDDLVEGGLLGMAAARTGQVRIPVTRRPCRYPAGIRRLPLA
ncbi:MAG: hypothetical protein WBG92_07745 [Thiohalocapsa sp.]